TPGRAVQVIARNEVREVGVASRRAHGPAVGVAVFEGAVDETGGVRGRCQSQCAQRAHCPLLNTHVFSPFGSSECRVTTAGPPKQGQGHVSNSLIYKGVFGTK